MSGRRRALGCPDETVLVAYYEGAYGPTLRLDVQTLDSLAEIREIARRLSSGGLPTFSLEQMRSMVMEPPLDSITLSAEPPGQAAEPSTRRTSRQIGPRGSIKFHWAQTPAEWARTAGLIEGLYDAGACGRPGHQYLTDESPDEVLVELAFRE